MEKPKKIYIILMTHGEFGAELVKSTEMVIGKIHCVNTFSLFSDESIEEYMKAVSNTIKTFKEYDFLFLVDVLGGTPYNLACILAEEYGGEVITGLNMNLLITADELRKNSNISSLPSKIIDSMKEKDFYIKHYKK